MTGKVNLVKLSVGTESVAGLTDWQNTRRAQAPDGKPRHVTRMWPKREAELLDGGSLYWVIKGAILCRQPIARLDEYVGADGIRRCAIVLEPGLIRTTAAPKRPFQGWRYLMGPDAPLDLTGDAADREDDLPPTMEVALAEIGVL
ncbi:MAG: DUF1489 domain-containing protein [Pseudomonadota bacterium]